VGGPLFTLFGGSLITLMKEEASTSETLVNVFQTLQGNNPVNLHTHRRENLKSHQAWYIYTTDNDNIL
jgi:hypothetical protein